MFKRNQPLLPLPEGVQHYCITQVLKKTDGDSEEMVTVRDYSENFKTFPRKLFSKDFSLEAQQASGLTLKEVNSVLFHESELSDAEIEKINAEIDKQPDDESIETE